MPRRATLPGDFVASASMIDTAYVQRLARYNRWQNQNLYGCADGLSDEERRRERGAFFGSIHGTLSHLVWGDRMWMSRFSTVERPPYGVKDSVAMFGTWDELKRERASLDEVIVAWAGNLSASWIEGDLAYFSGASQRDMVLPKWLAVTHMFNHQTHHRGQVHCMLTQAGGKPHETDLPFMAE
jgi:uncharacterized damage-inducible protein DinB